jgi:CRP/FNR family transcriptional regulator, cyclic AMP receptor protein
MIEVTTAALAVHPFLRGMPRDQLDLLAEAARDVRFPARHRLFGDGGNANRFWLIQSGRVSLDLHVPGEGPVVIETIGMGEVLGWSWPGPARDESPPTRRRMALTAG